MLQYIMEARREGRMAVSEGRANNLNTMDDVYRVAAKKFNLTSSGVQKVVERNRRRIRERDRREIAAQTKDG